MKITGFIFLFTLLINNLWGQTNHSIEFTGGDDYINIGRPLNLFNGDVGSFSIWFKSSQTNGPRYFLSNDTKPTNPEFNFGLNNGYAYVNGGPGSTNGPTVQTTTVYADSIWHHAVGIKSGLNCVELYVDNNYIGSNCSGTGDMDNSEDYYIGDNRANGLADYIGLLDELRIYSRVLDSSEVDELFNCMGNQIPDLVAYYNFNSGSGTIVIDLAGSFNGAMNNMDGTTSWSNDVPCNSTSLEEQSIGLVKVYPNPTSQSISIYYSKMSEGGFAEISNLAGKTIYKEQLKAELSTIDLDVLNTKGIYIIRIMNGAGEQVAIEKFIYQ
jgi:Concanavalin A-like lectin/glucanases superfamily/Secretion system C-terminal sorting domain